MIQESLPFHPPVRDCLGRERQPDKVWPDGSYHCPFCCATVMAGKLGCPDPGCTAHVNEHGAFDYPVERARAKLKAAEERKAEADRRARDAEWSRKYREEREAERRAIIDAAITEAKVKGACERCLLKALRGGFGAPKFIRHRGPCPNALRW